MPDDWRNFLLRAIGAPENTVTLGSLTLWAHSEGVAPTCHNHLAATDRLIGDRPGPASAVFCYPSEGAMIALYANKLRSGIYSGIQDALVRGAQYADIWKAINASPWCPGCKQDVNGVNGPFYPASLYSAAFGDVTPPLSGVSPLFGDLPTPPPGRDASPTGPLPSHAPGPNYDDLLHAWDRLTQALAFDVPHAYRQIKKARKGIYSAVRLPRG
jgi:hypothetical protein